MNQTTEDVAYDYATKKTKFRKDVLKEVDTDSYVSRHADCMEDFQCGYSYCKKQSPWISVKDKLPEPEQEVFLYDRDSVKHYAIGWLRKEKGYCKSKWFVTNGYVTDESITHWMPIPELDTQLTDREMDVFRLIASNCQTDEIAAELHISPYTVNRHRENIKAKIKVRNVGEMISYWHQNQLK